MESVNIVNFNQIVAGHSVYYLAMLVVYYYDPKIHFRSEDLHQFQIPGMTKFLLGIK